MTYKTSICAKYKHVDGWHVFQSEDLPGLYVASRDAEKAFDDVSLSIETLIKLDEGIECTAVPEVSFKDFVKAMHASNDDDIGDFEHSPPVLSDRRFCVIGLAA